MSYRTDLQVVDPQVVPAKSTRVNPIPGRNARLHNSMELLSNFMISNAKSDSGNTRSHVIPRDKRRVYQYWNAIKTDMAFAWKHRDSGLSSHEEEFVCYLPDSREIRVTTNAKMQRLNDALFRLARLIMGSESYRVQTDITKADWEDFTVEVKAIDDLIKQWFGAEGNKEDEGLYIPDSKLVGDTSPAVDDPQWARVHEPSSANPETGLPDAPDTPWPQDGAAE